jgi:hypothetical protein
MKIKLLHFSLSGAILFGFLCGNAYSQSVWLDDASQISIQDQNDLVVLPDSDESLRYFKSVKKSALEKCVFVDLLRVRRSDAANLGVNLYAQSITTSYTPIKSAQILDIFGDEALSYLSARLLSLLNHSDTFDSVLLDCKLVTKGGFIYSQACREYCVKTFGLDPIDFNDPVEALSGTFQASQFNLPSSIVKALADKQQSVVAKHIDPFVKELKKRNKKIYLIGDVNTIRMPLSAKIASMSMWPLVALSTEIDGLWLKVSSDTSLSELGELSKQLNEIDLGLLSRSYTLFGQYESHAAMKSALNAADSVKLILRKKKF